MFSKILIANRGEIACRVIKTARRLGIATVAVYSEADADALHVRMADEAVAIGAAPASESYLRIDRIVEACKRTGAQAVHPGYGFVSENAHFAEALKAEGIVFIGPNVHAIQAMGDKIESKKLARAAGVSTVPGYLGEITDPDHAVKIAREIGYPVMVKASAGGGGKGMRIAHDDREVREGLTSAMNEARSSFGDDRVFIEKYVTEPRHIEIQVLGDKHGHVIYVGERECSIQRRHQKVIEEAPSPFLDAATRKAMGEQAVALAKAVDYESAGTVEFIVDKDRNFYFLEMNTRLQVEHPVTELVTGIDLVEQMIRVADSEPLRLRQEDVKLNGWAVEVRIYAEDPFRNFLPSTGRLVRYRPPAEGRAGIGTVRNDTGVYEGAEISLFYDPMIAKLCTHAPNREQAIDLMEQVLDSFYIRGIQDNIPFLSAVMANPRFREGRLSTNFIAEEFPDGFHGVTPEGGLRDALVAVAAFLQLREIERATHITGQLRPREHGHRDFVVTLDKASAPIRITPVGAEYHVVLRDAGVTLKVASDWQPGQTLFRGTVDGRAYWIQIDRRTEGWRLSSRGAQVVATVRTPRAAELSALMPEKVPPDTSKLLLCPMPGLVVAIPVEVGQEVKAGEPLAVVEAMKMENVLRAERDGTVSEIHAKPGDSLAVDHVILEFA